MNRREHNMTHVLIMLKDLRVGNGVAACIMAYYDELIASGFQVDFLLTNDVESEWLTMVKKHGRVYILPCKKYKYSKAAYKFLANLFVSNTYDLVHVNLPGPYGAWVLKMAKNAGVRKRIYHSHNPRNTSSIKARISSCIYGRLCVERANSYMACSSAAGQSIFKDQSFVILKNCIDVNNYRFNSESRDALRRELGIDDSVFFVGTVGRLEDQKNPFFALKCFEKILRCRNAKYAWIGDGTKRNAVEQYIAEHDLSNNMVLLGTQSNVNEWYSAFDILLLPSRAEGLGIVFIEAQASGLDCFGSTKVPVDTEVTNLMHRLPLDDPDAWSRKILDCNIKHDRAKYSNLVTRAGYDIQNNMDNLSKIYADLLNT